MLEPTSGTARVLGRDVVREAREVRRRMGAVLSDGRSLYWKLTARENLEYFAALYHVPPAEQRPLEELLPGCNAPVVWVAPR